MTDNIPDELNPVLDAKQEVNLPAPASASAATEIWKCQTREMEVRRLLAHLDHASVNDVVCEDSASKIANESLYEQPWKMSAKDARSIMQFVVDSRDKWANDGYFIIVEGGQREKDRRRVMNFLIYQAILARFSSYNYIARIFDWQSILSDISQYRNPDRAVYIECMTKISVLGINEFNLLMAPNFKHDLDVILTSIIRKRKFGKRPTIISMNKPSWDVVATGGDGYGTQIVELLQTPHDEDEDKVIRIRLVGGSSGWEKAEG